MIKREHYLKEIRPFYESDLIKIIVGIRRCGKSVILEQVMSEIKMKSDNIIYLNFENEMVLEQFKNAHDVIMYVLEHKKEGKCYLFLDEIQEMNQWSKICKTLRLENCSIFITGSNSKLLSREFTLELSGGFVSFKVRPFVYKEIVEYSKELGKEANMMDYIIWGGFPNRFNKNSKEEEIDYLNNLKDSIIYDLIDYYQIRKVDLFKKLVHYVITQNGKMITMNRIHEAMNRYIPCSINTIMMYMNYLNESLIIEFIKQYSFKEKRELAFYVKLYDEDVAFSSLRAINKEYDYTHNLENIVYNELIYMGYSLNVININGKEIDFLASKEGYQYYIQVSFSVIDPKTKERELSLFYSLDNSIQKILITNDDVDFSTSTIRHIKLKDFLLMESL